MGENPPRLNWGSLLDIQTFCGYRMSSEDIQLQRQTERTYCFPEFDKVVNKVMERGGGVRLHHIVHNFYSQLNNYLEFVTPIKSRTGTLVSTSTILLSNCLLASPLIKDNHTGPERTNLWDQHISLDVANIERTLLLSAKSG